MSITQTVKRGQNSFMRLHSELEIEKGLNLRVPSRESIDEKKVSIIANGVITDFRVMKKRGNDKYTVIEGHTRYIAIGECIEEGTLPPDFLIPCKSQADTSDIDVVFAMFTSNSGEPLPPIAKAEGYRRLIHYGKTVAQISERLGVSVKHINDCLILLNANHGLQQLVKDNVVSATEVSQRLRKDSSDTIESQVKAVQQKTGKKKVTKRDLPKKQKTARTVQTDLTKQVTKNAEFRNWLNLQGYPDVLKKFNELFD